MPLINITIIDIIALISPQVFIPTRLLPPVPIFIINLQSISTNGTSVCHLFNTFTIVVLIIHTVSKVLIHKHVTTTEIYPELFKDTKTQPLGRIQIRDEE